MIYCYSFRMWLITVHYRPSGGEEAIKFPVTVADGVFPAYDMSYLNKWKIYTESVTGRGSSSEVPPLIHARDPFITLQKALSQHYPSPALYGDHSLDVSPKNTEASAAQEHLQDEIY